MSEKVLIAKDIYKSYSQAGEKLEILKDASLEIAKNEVVGLVGPSGSGKSTFLHILGLLDKPDSGLIMINNKDCSNANEQNRTYTRSKELGFIYQFHHLLAEFTALENVLMPLNIQGRDFEVAKKEASEVLEVLGLSKRVNHLPSELSGGEQQRVAIARAIVSKPSLILADEPTGNLDPSNSSLVFDLLVKTVKDYGLSILIVTHNMHYTRYFSRVYTIKEGSITLFKE